MDNNKITSNNTRNLINNPKIFRFKCTMCGKCCSDSSTFVNLTFLDIIRIKKFLNLTPQELLNYVGFYTFKEDEVPPKFMERMMLNPVLTERGSAFLGLLKDDHSRCLFLGRDNKCTIYNSRPQICRAFPFTYTLNETENQKQKLNLIYASKALEYCPGISKHAPIVKKRKKLKLIRKIILEIEKDKQIVTKWNKKIKNNEIEPKATSYILFLAKLDN
ncbi:MAG: hypothetical protein GF364_19195 [Candidatus Lokiarchaeota archaeon]|nr:hypothetical protein [Candidatus Lokiarchaeota archaeon]